MKIVRSARWRATSTEHVLFTLDDAHTLMVQVLDRNLLRLLLLKDGALRLDRTWSVCPGAPELPYSGRPRLSAAGFPRPIFSVRPEGSNWWVETDAVRLLVHACPFYVEFFMIRNGENASPVLSGTPTGFLSLGRRDDRVWNLWKREAGDRFYGLGEKSGNLDRAGRRFEMRCLDALGYDAETTDPLYKHYPFLILKRARSSVGLFYDNLSPVVFDTGQELDNYHGEFFSYRAPAGDLDLYLMFAPEIRAITRTFSWMTGRTRLGPRWSLGYSGSTMGYSEAPNAQELLETFARNCQHHDIPCHSFQLSSGYTSIGSKRYVFTWNREKFPDPIAMARTFHAAGIQLAANVKPVLLTDHPAYGAAAAAGLFIRDSDSPEFPEVSRFWDASASHLDFTNSATRTWWRENITERLFRHGVDGVWNDNNEFEIWDDRALCHGVHAPLPVQLLRPVQTLLMMQTSYRAHRRRFPTLRPWAISRSGAPGMQRYVQTWSGDNLTDWKTLRYNIRMGLSLSLSGMFNIGHDVGGFAGDAPEPELLVRWVQNGIFHPRFTIHSWNRDGSVTEPWMYPEHLPLIRAAMRLRLRLAPYLYTLLARAHFEYEPILRPTFHDHEDDPLCFRETDDFMLGPSLLVANVVEPGAAVRAVYLPRAPEGWVDFYSGRWFAGGQTLRVPVLLESIPLFVKAGHALPLTTPHHRAFTDGGTDRSVMIFPGRGTKFQTELYEDDGVSLAYERGGWTRLRLDIATGDDRVEIRAEREGPFTPIFNELSFEVKSERPQRLSINGQPGERWRFA